MDVAAARGAGGHAAGVEAGEEVLVAAELPRVPPVPPRPGEDAGPRPRAPAVGDNLWPALDGVQGTVHAAPVANGKDVVRANARDGDGGPRHALVVQRALRRLALDAQGVALTAGAFRHRRSSPEAGVAGGLGAHARGRAAALSTRGSAEEEALEVALIALLVRDAADLLHLAVPCAGVGVPLAARGRPPDPLGADKVGWRCQGLAHRR
mmetsp:Transcript_67591/g.200996  ORF Transcript_67591/g.200996 Transcript_67591/m.200996 type:complete len:209 (-) Transcript_67591:267-893(-)